MKEGIYVCEVKMKNLIKAFVISALVLSTFLPFSCKVTEQGIVLLNTNEYKFPELDSFSVTGEKSLRLAFTESVELEECLLTPDIGISSKTVQNSWNGNLCLYEIEFSEKFQVGRSYSFYGVVTDRTGNSLSFSLPFSGFNGDVPELMITEVHPKYTSSKLSSGTVFKCEYIELLVTKGGNLAGLELFSANDGSEKAYKFPALEVKTNEIILVHLRSKGEGIENELENDIGLSTGKYASSFARDLWAENETARLGDDMDVILLRNTWDGSVLDAVTYAPSGAADWKSVEMAEAALSAASFGAWNSEAVGGAVCSDGMTATKSFLRTGKFGDSDSWCLSKTSGETPGVLDFSY